MTLRHSIRTRMFLSGQWRDFTDKVRVEDRMDIERGRDNESDALCKPQTCKLTLDNRSGDFSMRNPMGAWYGALNRNVPLEVARGVTTDSFSRTSVDGWGSDDNGNAWSVLATGNVPSPASADFDVASGVGTVVVPAATNVRLAYLAGVTYTDVDVSASMTLAVTDITGSVARPLNLVVRGLSTTNYVYASLRIETNEAITISVVNADGTVYASTTVTSLTHSAAQGLSMRVQAEGATVRAKVWPTASGEPLAWSVTSTALVPSQRGFVGVRCSTDTGNTNANLVVSVDNFRVDSMRFSGEVANWPSGSDVSNKDKVVSIEAAGIMRRLGQGKSPVLSSLRRGTMGIGTELRAYWPGEDGKNATSLASGIGGPALEVISGSAEFAASDDFPGSLPVPKVSLSAWSARVPWYDWSINGSTQLRFLVSIPAAGTVNDTVLAQIGCEGTATLWQIVYLTGSGGQLSVKAYDPGGTLILTGGPASFSTDGTPMRLSLELDQNGADVAWSLSSVNLSGTGGGISGTLVGRVAGRVDQVWITPQALNDGVGVGHITMESAITSLFANDDEMFGWKNEKGVDRMIRLCRENDVPFYWTDVVGDTPKMGPQRALPLLDLLKECATTDGGTLFEPAGTLGINYRSRSSAYAQSPKLILDVSANEVAHPFQPVEDDQQTRNDVEVKNANGSSARVTLDTGRMSIQPYPNGIDVYDTSVEVNLASDGLLLDQAWWRLALGTVDEARYPDLSVDLDGKPALIPTMLDVGVDDLVHIMNASGVGIYNTIKQLVRGYSETWTNHRGVFRINATPYAPYDVEVLDSDYRLDSGTSKLTSNPTSTATSISVTTTNPFDLWTTTDFPFDITVAGETMRVTNITGASSPQTFTVTRSINGVVKAHTANTEVHVLNPFRLGL